MAKIISQDLDYFVLKTWIVKDSIAPEIDNREKIQSSLGKNIGMFGRRWSVESIEVMLLFFL